MAVNGWFETEEQMPQWGQLGCNGFILLDARLQIVSPATEAYLLKRERAFAHLETLLDAELEGVGNRVRVAGEEEVLDVDSRPMGELASVCHVEMDRQHLECAGCFNSLRETREPEQLAQLIEVMARHFECEEQLLDLNVYAGIQNLADGFSPQASARASHFGDHARILVEARAEYAKGRERVSAVYISKAMREFETHAEMYDCVYAGVV
eukprot:TRINITY_DN7914_c0_g1_i2.p1 TRINITY_DN7914_c0_g1~~TRINITY_DN7914_c0_g1_i2.p1  ORF type:complete len:210 (-),score=50.96 TRINITY_DN7914_c0_g1_i2:381-1010(-)